MEPNNKSSNEEAKELLEAVTHISNHNIAYLNSMALKCAIQLGIPEAIHKHGKPVTIDELAKALSIHPNKAPSLHQLMRLLVHSKFFATKTLTNNNINGDETLLFDLTLNSQLLLKDHPLTQAPLTLMGADPLVTKPSHNFATWFQNHDVKTSESPFYFTYGRHLYEGVPSDDTKFDDLFQQAMTSDSQLIARVLLTSNEFKGVMHGVESLVDVGGGDGTMASSIAVAYPEVKCTVFDLPNVVEGIQRNEKVENLTYVAGDMFEAIPRAQVILLKWILHNWSDENCIKVLKQCKEAIPRRDKGGKLLIIDMVVGIPSDNLNQLLADVHMMSLLGGKERSEQQWKYLFINAGFSDDYRILPILGPRSVIEVYPA
ncbi:trans-resveratrol di-O-methyltransferase-like [Chenopodium quinoa]|uniref:trans-resveratrol di-O-methyltransferase-like n=1 Tax=Chenopodium quinoa TaxID=63459 RepID=UPI000B76ED56|nr:trans-resveratrol di-O-methyltransferase-like [Chenopodium quinoa]